MPPSTMGSDCAGVPGVDGAWSTRGAGDVVVDGAGDRAVRFSSARPAGAAVRAVAVELLCVMAADREWGRRGERGEGTRLEPWRARS